MLMVLDKDKKEVEFSMKELLSMPLVKKYYDFYEHLEFQKRSGKGYVSYKLPVHSNRRSRDEISFLYMMLGQYYNRFVFTKDGVRITNGIPLVEIEDSEEARLAWLQRYMGMYYARGTMPCPSRYAALEIDHVWPESTFDDFELEYPIMVCPYVRRYEDDGDFYSRTKSIEYDVDDAIIDFVYKHRKNASVTKEEISEAYAKLRDEYDPALRALNKK